jgi:hypothetical protein
VHVQEPGQLHRAARIITDRVQPAPPADAVHAGRVPHLKITPEFRNDCCGFGAPPGPACR